MMSKAQYVLDYIDEKWGVKNAVNPAEKGKYKGVSADEMKSRLAKLKASGPHPKGSKEYGEMRELQFALRAKSGWGKVQ